MGKIRAFIALNTSEEAQSKIFEIQQCLSDIQSDVKWEPREKFHITLKFLGDVEETTLASITEEIRSELNGFGSFPIEYNILGAFPNFKLPRVLWIGASDKEKKVFGLNKTIEAELKNHKFDDESNRFHPHITLGRIKGIRGVRDVIETMQKHKHKGIIDSACEVCIMKSTLTREGSFYGVVDKIKL
jgi:2'-5' RNA ligase